MSIRALKRFGCQLPNIVYGKTSRTFTPRALVARSNTSRFTTPLAASAHEYSPYPTFESFLPTYKRSIIYIFQLHYHDSEKLTAKIK